MVKIHAYLEHQNSLILGFMGCKQTWSGVSQAVGSLAQTANSTNEYLRLFDIHQNIGQCGYFITQGQNWAFMDIVQDSWGKNCHSCHWPHLWTNFSVLLIGLMLCNCGQNLNSVPGRQWMANLWVVSLPAETGLGIVMVRGEVSLLGFLSLQSVDTHGFSISTYQLSVCQDWAQCAKCIYST